MSTRSENIRFNVYLNDSHAGNTMSNLNKQSKILNSELNKLQIGSKLWIDKMKELHGVQNQISRVKDEIKGTNTSMDKMSSFLNHHFALITAIIAGATAAIMAFRNISDNMVIFEKTFTDVITLLSESEKIKYGPELKAGSIQIMRDYGFAIADTNKGLFEAISSAIPAGDAINFMNRASILAIGGTTTLATSVDGLTTVINAWGLEMDEVSSVTDAFYSAQKEGKTTVDELAKSIGTIAPVAAMAGISYQEILGSMAALTIKGISTAEAATYLRGAINGLISPGKQAEEVLRSMGVPVGITELKTAGLAKTLTILSEALRENPDAVGEALPNIRGMQAAVALTGEGLENFNRILNIVNNDVGNFSSLMFAFNDQQATMSQMIERSKAKWRTSVIELSDMLKPVLVSVFGLLSQTNHLMIKTFVWIRDNMGIFTALKNIVINLTAAWGAYKIMLGAIWIKHNLINQVMGIMNAVALRSAIIYNTLTGNIGRAAAAQRVLNTAIASNPWGIMASIITSVGMALYQFVSRAKEATEAQRLMNEQIEIFKRLKEESMSIEKQAKGIDYMSEDQVNRFKADLDHQLQLIEDYGIQKKIIEQRILNETVKTYNDAVKQFPDPHDLKVKLENPGTWAVRDIWVQELSDYNDRIKQLNGEQLEEWRNLAEQRDLTLTINDKSGQIDKMSKEQLKAFIDVIDQQLKVIQAYTLDRVGLEEQIADAGVLAQEQFEKREEGELNSFIYTDDFILKHRNDLMLDLISLDKKLAYLNEDRLNKTKAYAENMMLTAKPDGFIPLPDDGKKKDKTVTEKSTFINIEDDLDKLQKIIEKVAEAHHEIELSHMTSDQKEIQMVHDKYQKLIDEAEGYIDTQEIIDMRESELDDLRVRQDNERINAKIDAQAELDIFLMNDQEKELQSLDEQYEAMLVLTSEFGLDETLLLEQKLKAQQVIKDKYAKEEADNNATAAKKKHDDQLEAAIGTVQVFANTIGAASAMMDEQSDAYRSFAIFAATLDAIGAALAAYKSTAEIPIVGAVLAPIAAAAALVFGMANVRKMRQTQLESSSAKYEKGGIAHGSKHTNGGIHLIDSRSGKKVGEMEDGEPYMILSDKTYKNNKSLIDMLLQSSMNGNGEQVSWASTSSMPQPDFSRLSQVSRSYSYGGITNNYRTITENTPKFSSSVTDQLLRDILIQMQSDEYRNTVIDQDNILALRKAIKRFDKIEGRAKNFN